jgi:hypothetical protein
MSCDSLISPAYLCCYLQRQIRITAVCISIILYVSIIYYLANVFKPPESLVDFYDTGDDDFNLLSDKG